MKLYTDPTVRKIAQVAVATYQALPAEVLPSAIALAQQAYVEKESGADRFAFVLDGLKAKFPDLAENELRALIENVVLVLKNG